WAFTPRTDGLPVAEIVAPRKRASRLSQILPQIERALNTVKPGEFLPREPFEAQRISPRICQMAIKCEMYELVKIDFRADDENDAIAAKLRAASRVNRAVFTRIAFWRELESFLEGNSTSAPRLQMVTGDRTKIRMTTPYLVHPQWLD